MILHEDQHQRVEAHQGLVTILDKATGQTRDATDDEADAWIDHWTRAAPGTASSQVEPQPDLRGGRVHRRR